MSASYYNVSVGYRSGEYPKVSVAFSRDDDEHGYTARVELWPNGDGPPACIHKLWVRQGMPLGELWIAFDGGEHGAWATADISGATLNERDLEWAANWAKLAMKHKHLVTQSCNGHEQEASLKQKHGPLPAEDGGAEEAGARATRESTSHET